MLHIGPELIYTVINVLILYFILKRFLFKPVRDILAKRNEEIEGEYKKAEQTNAAANELKKQYQDSLDGIDAERERTIAQAKDDAYVEAGKIIDDANKQAEELIADAKAQADREAVKRRKEAQEEIADLIGIAASKIALGVDSSQNDRSLYDEFLTKADQKSSDTTTSGK